MTRYATTLLHRLQTILIDSGTKIVTTSTTNDQEVYVLPLQHAIDFAIAAQNATIDQSAVPKAFDEYPLTSMTQKDRNNQIRVRYMGGII